MVNKIKVAELFAGVGGFRLGLEGWKNKSASSNYKKKLESPYEIVWSNQWEPSTKVQHASMVYENHWNDQNHCNQDISTVEISQIPDHDLLVGGFPCQDYSVATTLKNSKGLIGKKGVLWWSIHKILSEKTNKPKYLFLENVDRLLISPSGQRGRDFAIILKSLSDLGYAVEWRVINAAEYGMPQRRRRIGKCFSYPN
jgi:DNA (cytosine-5)-methyltransferase 1